MVWLQRRIIFDLLAVYVPILVLQMGHLLNTLGVEIGNHVTICKDDDLARLVDNDMQITETLVLQNSEQRVQDATQETDKETQMCASELPIQFTDHNEFGETSIPATKKDLYESADGIASFRCKMASIR
uniref:Uncharacterized protein n=1 Tax=Oryza brachyantha TaxID=4533 RepID=J3MQ33_ORYBR